MPKQRARADASRAYKRFKEAAKKAGVTARNPSSRAMPWAAGSGMSQKSSLPQAAKSVSRVLMSDEEEWIRASSAIAHMWARTPWSESVPGHERSCPWVRADFRFTPDFGRSRAGSLRFQLVSTREYQRSSNASFKPQPRLLAADLAEPRRS
jgi:hypothetical protein